MWQLVIVQAFTLTGIGISAYFSYRAKIESSAANDAVNRRHEGTPRLFDMVLSNHSLGKELFVDVKELFVDIKEIRKSTDNLESWQDQYEGGPLDTGQKVKDFVQAIEKKFETIDLTCARCKLCEGRLESLRSQDIDDDD